MIISVPLSPDKPIVIDYTQLYTPDDPDNNGRYVPAVGSLVWKNNVPYKVVSINDTTNASELVPAFIANEDSEDSISSKISWGNDILRLYIDNRSIPYRVQVDPSMILLGGAPSFYTITRYPDDKSKSHIISKYYDSTGRYAKNQVPVVPVDNKITGWICDTCSVSEDLEEDEELQITVYNEVGAEIRTATVFSKHSSIINDKLDYRPRIVGLSLKSPQQLDDGTIFLYEKQDFSSVNIYGELRYEDNTTQLITVDNYQTYLYGAEDFVPSYSGMKQNIYMKYFFGPSETSNSTDPTNTSIMATGQVMVIANKEAVPVKVSVIPVYDNASQQYSLKFYIYTTSRNRVVDCTPFTTITNNSFNGADFVHTQQLQISVDMTKVDPSVYQGIATYTQGVSIKLLPPTSYVRYILSDSISSPFTYGNDSSSDRRPVLYYDSEKQLYFISSSIFTNQPSVLQSFYYNSNPPYDTRIEQSVPVPTHFGIRDPYSGILVSMNPLSSYTKGFSVSNNKDYTNQTIIVEFHTQNSDNELIIFGVPVDIHPGSLVS